MLCDDPSTGTVTYIQPAEGCSTRFRFIQVFGVYWVTSKTTQRSTLAISARWGRYGKKYGCMMPRRVPLRGTSDQSPGVALGVADQ